MSEFILPYIERGKDEYRFNVHEAKEGNSGEFEVTVRAGMKQRTLRLAYHPTNMGSHLTLVEDLTDRKHFLSELENLRNLKATVGTI